MSAVEDTADILTPEAKVKSNAADLPFPQPHDGHPQSHEETDHEQLHNCCCNHLLAHSLEQGQVGGSKVALATRACLVHPDKVADRWSAARSRSLQFGNRQQTAGPR